MAAHNRLGNAGEEAAARYLERKGYWIKERNWRIGHLELDIVAQHEGQLVVVEVKTLKEGACRAPEEAVGRTKIRHILHAADAYVKLHGIDWPLRFDIVSVMEDAGDFRVVHYEDAFSPIDY